MRELRKRHYILELIVSYAIEYIQRGGRRQKKRKKEKHVEEHWTVGWMMKEMQKKLLLEENNTRK